jgi:hypothetical protein
MPVHDLGASILLAHVDYTRLARLIFTTLHGRLPEGHGEQCGPRHRSSSSLRSSSCLHWCLTGAGVGRHCNKHTASIRSDRHLASKRPPTHSASRWFMCFTSLPGDARSVPAHLRCMMFPTPCSCSCVQICPGTTSVSTVLRRFPPARGRRLKARLFKPHHSCRS